MKPMCAFRYQDKGSTLPENFFVQPKLNGVRCLYNNGFCQTRNEHMWHPDKVAHIVGSLINEVPSNWFLDGEFYLHGLSLQKINGLMSVSSQVVTPKTQTIQYWVFDGFNKNNPLQPFSERFSTISAMLSPLATMTPIRVVPTQQCDRAGAEILYRKALSAGFEGTMYRDPSSPYGHAHLCTNQDNRWNYLLKRKDFLDADVEIVGFAPGTGKYAEAVGSLICLYSNGKTFHVGSGFSDAERFRYIDAPPIGHTARIRYEMLSDDGTPLKPTFEAIVD